MAKLIFGDRISKTGKLATGCAGILFDAKRERILLTRRTDNGRWCLPGGRMEVGEGIAALFANFDLTCWFVGIEHNQC